VTDDGRLIAGRYRLVERIGSGAMGVVWRAYDERLGRTVAVKKMLLAPGLPPDEADEAVQRCMREGRIAAKLHHPNAITVYDVVDEDGVPILIMEYLESVSLAAALDQRGTLTPREVARIGAEVAAALTAAHAAGIVHRDLKPGNILLGQDGSVKITDFGISRAADDVTVTKTGMIAGTPAYLAPEVAIGRPPEAPSDVFSLGSTLYAATEGEPPFGLSENTLGVLHAVAAGRINPPRRSGPMTGVLAAMLNADPLRRPNSAQTRELLEDVANGHMPDVTRFAMAEGPTQLVDPRTDETQVIHAREARSVPRTQRVGPPPAGPTVMTGPGTRPTARQPVRSKVPLVAAGIVLVALLAVGGFLLANRDNDPPQQGPAGADTSQQQAPTTDDATPTSEVEQTVAPTTTRHRPTTTTTTTTETTTTETTTTTTDETTTETSTTTSNSVQPST
jgi:eukaryotic-like serine/threonine-protein kinase